MPAFASAPTKLEILTALVHAKQLADAQPIPAEGTYTLAEWQQTAQGCCSGSFTAKYYADVRHSLSGGPFLDVTFRPHGKTVQRREIRVAIDGSWRDASTLLPVNVYGDIRA